MGSELITLTIPDQGETFPNETRCLTIPGPGRPHGLGLSLRLWACPFQSIVGIHFRFTSIVD